MSFGTRDETGPLTPIAQGGVDVAAGAEVQLLAASSVDPDTGLPARLKVDLEHGGATGRVWIGIGQTATAGSGLWLEPGGSWSEYYGGAVRVRNAGSDPVRMTWVEWGA